jgi:hypothetical protein
MSALVSAALTPMSSEIGKYFGEYAQCCSELAREAATPESRQRLLNMAREYLRAADLVRATDS